MYNYNQSFYKGVLKLLIIFHDTFLSVGYLDHIRSKVVYVEGQT